MTHRFRITCLFIAVSLSLLTPACKKKVAVAPPPPPVHEEAPAPPSAPTASLIAEPTTVQAGQAVTLKWSSTNATDVEISGVGTVSAEGKDEVRPAQSTTYKLVAKGPGGSTSASATVTVTVAPPPPPAVVAPPPVEAPSLLARLESEVSDVYFDYDKSNLREDARGTLIKNAEALRLILADFPNAVIVVEGHCDERGSAEYNLALSDERAATVVAYLEGIGLQKGRLQTIGYGKERPMCSESTEECWQKNRRVHFTTGASAITN